MLVLILLAPSGTVNLYTKGNSALIPSRVFSDEDDAQTWLMLHGYRCVDTEARGKNKEDRVSGLYKKEGEHERVAVTSASSRIV